MKISYSPGYEVLKHAFAISVGPENYGVIRNGTGIERREEHYGEMFGLAFKSMIAAGSGFTVTSTRQVPKTWWDHVKHDFLVWLKVGPPQYDWEELCEDEIARGEIGPLIGPPWKKTVWELFRFNVEIISICEEHKHLCPHIDIDFRQQPSPHYRWLLEGTTPSQSQDSSGR